MGPRGFWIALAIVLFYLIARPHIGTVWHVVLPAPQSLPSDIPSGAVPLTPPPGFVAVTPPPQAFTVQLNCIAAADDLRRTGGVNAGAYCAQGYGLLWGW
jgi:hypothetical protein